MVTQAPPALAGNETGHYDGIVIGSGAGGGTLNHAEVNPTLTIIANALRVAGHIAERLGATAGAQAQPALARLTSHA